MAHPEVWEGSGGPPGWPGGVERPSHRAGRGWEAHPVVREGSKGQPGDPREVGRPTRKSERGLEDHQEVRMAHAEVW